MSASTFGDSGVILLFHRVAAVDHDPDGLAVPPAVFSQQMANLRETCRPVPLPDSSTPSDGGVRRGGRWR